MESRLKTPLTAVVVIFICSCVAAVLTFSILGSTATFQNNKGLQLGGAIVGLLVTFSALWHSFRTFSSELGQTDRERLEEQLKNLQDQLVRQDPPPSGYHRLLSEDFKIVAHIPNNWTTSKNTMIIFAPSTKGAATFMDNIVIYRNLAKWHYRELQLQKQRASLSASYDPAQDHELQKNIVTLKKSYSRQAEEPSTNDMLGKDIASLEEKHKERYITLKLDKLKQDLYLRLNDPVRDDEKIEEVLDLELEVLSSQMLGVPERTEVAGYQAIRYQIPNPLQQLINLPIVNLVTDIFVTEGEGYIYQVTLTSTPDAVSQLSIVYSRVLNSIRFIT